MHHIGVVPEDAEVGGGGLHERHPLHHLIREGYAGGVGVLGHAPDALDGIVLAHQRFDDIHVGTVLFHGDGDHLDAELLSDREMPVVAGSRADEFDALELAPRSGPEHAELHREMHERVHEIQAAAVGGDDLGGLHAEQLGEQRAAGFGAGEGSVVAGVDIFGRIVVRRRAREHGHGDLELSFGGSAAGHVHAAPFFDEFLELLLFLGEHLFELAAGKRFVIHNPPVVRAARRVRQSLTHYTPACKCGVNLPLCCA